MYQMNMSIRVKTGGHIVRHNFTLIINPPKIFYIPNHNYKMFFIGIIFNVNMDIFILLNFKTGII